MILKLGEVRVPRFRAIGKTDGACFIRKRARKKTTYNFMNVLHERPVNSSHKKWVEEILKTKNYVQESKWSQSIAVGSKSFVEGIKEKLGIRAKGRKVGESGGLYHLREAQVPYNSDFTPENSELRAKNTYFWSDNP